MVGVEYSFLLLVLLCFYISWKNFKSGNTVNTEYLNRIANPEYLTGANGLFINSIVLKENFRNFIVTMSNATTLRGAVRFICSQFVPNRQWNFCYSDCHWNLKSILAHNFIKIISTFYDYKKLTLIQVDSISTVTYPGILREYLFQQGI